MTENQDQSQEQNEVPAPAEENVKGILKQMQHQLVFLEKKIDLLTNKIEAMARAAAQPAAPPARPFPRSDHHQDFRPHGGHESAFPSRPFRLDKPRSFGKARHSHGGDKPFDGGKSFGGGKRPFGSSGKRHIYFPDQRPNRRKD